MKTILIILLVILTENTYCQLKLGGEELKVVSKEFHSLIAKGDSCFIAKNYEYAIGYYKNAYELVFGYEQISIADSINNYNAIIEENNKKAKLLQDLIWQEQLNNISGTAEERYNKYIKLADQYFNNSYGGYIRSKQAYLKASQLIPNENYPINQIISLEVKQYEKDSLQRGLDEMLCNLEILMKFGKYNEAKVYVNEQNNIKKLEGNVKSKKYRDIETSLNEQLKRLQKNKDLDPEKYNREMLYIKQQLMFNQYNKSGDEALRKSFSDICAKYSAQIDYSISTKK